LVFVRDGAMIQRCWDTGCRGRFQRFVLQDGRVVAAQVSTVPGDVCACACACYDRASCFLHRV
jgi:hypothetical protein